MWCAVCGVALWHHLIVQPAVRCPPAVVIHTRSVRMIACWSCLCQSKSSISSGPLSDWCWFHFTSAYRPLGSELFPLTNCKLALRLLCSFLYVFGSCFYFRLKSLVTNLASSLWLTVSYVFCAFWVFHSRIKNVCDTVVMLFLCMESPSVSFLVSMQSIVR